MWKQPTTSPSLVPSVSSQPSSKPSGAPSTVPSIDPSLSPSLVPSVSSQPSRSGQPSTQPSSQPSSSQRNYLAALYHATNGDNWTRKGGWLVNSNECTWRGVTCNSSGIVTKLSLINNNLVGTIPVEITALTELGKFLTFETLLLSFCSSLLTLLTAFRVRSQICDHLRT